MNERPIEHTCAQGTLVFTCDRADLSRTPIHVTGDIRSEEHLACAVAEFTAWHALNIFPQLNGFAGYDTLDFRLP